jgi:hypothetical protein
MSSRPALMQGSPIHRATRCSATRESEFITLSTARNIIEAALFADAIGHPLNRFVTINWSSGGCTGGTKANTRWLKLAGDWLAKRGVPRTWIWVREAGAYKGEHIHIALYVPPSLGAAFGRQQGAWLKLCGARRRKGVIHTRPVGRNASHALNRVSYGEDYLDHLRTTVEYLLKGVSVDTARELGITQFREDGGGVVGLRAGTSTSIGKGARALGVMPWHVLIGRDRATTGCDDSADTLSSLRLSIGAQLQIVTPCA